MDVPLYASLLASPLAATSRQHARGIVGHLPVGAWLLLLLFCVVNCTGSVIAQPVEARRDSSDARCRALIREVQRGQGWFNGRRGSAEPGHVIASADAGVHDSAQLIRQDVDTVAGFGGFCFEYSGQTYVPSLHLRKQISAYSHEISLPFTILGKDTGGVVYASWTVLVTASIGLMGEAVFGEWLGMHWLQMGIRYALFYPWAYLNSLHGLVIMGPEGVASSESARVLFLAGSRLDCFGSANPWMRWTPMVGFQIEFKTGADRGDSRPGWWGFCIGSEIPFDGRDRLKSGEPRLFVGLRAYQPVAVR